MIESVVMSEATATVTIIDNDPAFCRSTEELILSAEFKVQVEIFATAREFLCRERPEAPACVVLEAGLPGLSGLEMQRKLDQAGVSIPLIFVAQYGDIAMAVQAIKAGAVDFLTKPVQKEELLINIRKAFHHDQAACKRQQRLTTLRANYELLTPAERKVMARVISGLLNKQTAAQLGITEKTVKFHRGHIMRKMKTPSVVDLARMASELGIFPPSLPQSDEKQAPETA